jgi:hypothetical protein
MDHNDTKLIVANILEVLKELRAQTSALKDIAQAIRDVGGKG